MKPNEASMARIKTAGFLFVVGICLTIWNAVASADNQKTGEGNKGVTVEDLGRGLKSAAQNVEKEIPKIGSAIGETFKKITEKSSDKKPIQEPAQEPAKDKK
jgi:hypothetical protein